MHGKPMPAVTRAMNRALAIASQAEPPAAAHLNHGGQQEAVHIWPNLPYTSARMEMAAMRANTGITVWQGE